MIPDKRLEELILDQRNVSLPGAGHVTESVISLLSCCNNPCSNRSANEKILIIAGYSNPMKKFSNATEKIHRLNKNP